MKIASPGTAWRLTLSGPTYMLQDGSPEVGMAPSDDVHKTVYHAVDLAELRYPQVCEGLQYWQSLKGTRDFPSRDQIKPRAIPRLLKQTVLIKVLEGGKDFLFVVVGDEVLRSYKSPLLRKRLSEVALEMPHVAAYWEKIYRTICRVKKPVAIRYQVGLEGEAKFSNAEAVLLPLGPTDAEVDHIVTFGERRMM